MSTLAIKPDFIDLQTGQMRIWEQGEGPTLLVLPGLMTSPQAICRQVFEAFTGHRVVVLELPGLGASPASAGRTVEAVASTVDAVAGRIGSVAGCIAFDLSIAVALQCTISKKLKHRLLLVDLQKAQFLSEHKSVCGEFDLDSDGTYLYKLWNHIRDVDLLESFEPRRPRGRGAYKSAEELDEAFLCFAVQPAEYADLWGCLTNKFRQIDKAQIASATVLENINAVDLRIFSAAPLSIESGTVSSQAVLGIRRGYEDISSGRIHYRTNGAGESGVVALLAGPFSSSLLSPLLLNLSGNHTVVAPDYIGQGDSCRSPEDTTIVRAAADIDELTRRLGWSRYSIYGTHTGAGVALEAAIAFPDRVKSVVIDSCSMQHASERTEHIVKYFPSIFPDVCGSHIFKMWNIQKDGEIFWPWYSPESSFAKESTSTGLSRLHDSVICMLRSRTTPVWKSMSIYEARNRLSMVHQPVLFVTGPKDIFKNYVPEAKKLAPENFEFMDVPATAWAAKADPENVKKTCEIFDAFFLKNSSMETEQ